MPVRPFSKRGTTRAKTNRKNRRRRPLSAESLEHRRLLATLTVISSGDGGIGVCNPISCTLRDAVETANRVPGDDTIEFDPSITGTISLDAANGSLLISDAISIQGPGAEQLTVQADTTGGDFRVIDVDTNAGNVTIDGLTIRGGRVTGEGGGGIRFRSSGTLSLQSSVISGNTASSGGGLQSLYDGNVQLSESVVSGNSATDGEGGGIQMIDGDLSLSSSQISGNTSLLSGGGVISRYQGAIEITNSQVEDNLVNESGYHGGGVLSGDGSLTITSSTISGNTSAGDGGGIHKYRGTLSLNDVQISNNQAAYSGGGVRVESATVTITNSTLELNRASYSDGGGIAIGNGTLTIARSTIDNNVAAANGGGIATSGGLVRIVDSTVSTNQAGANGGGLATFTGPVSLVNSTISGNSSFTAGGGIHSGSAAVLIVQSTLTKNESSTQGGGIGVIATDDGEQLTLLNSIVARNVAPTAADLMAPGDPTNHLQVEHSLIGDSNGSSLSASVFSGNVPLADAAGNLIGGGEQPVIDPLLSDLAMQGGATAVHLPMGSSPAIDAGDNAFAIDPGPDGVIGGGDDSPLGFDQRGDSFTRIRDGVSGTLTVDIGSVETPTAFDFGDAPTPFPTSLADNGARHRGDGSLRLGSLRDLEFDGQPSTAADSDGADEDGVVILSPPIVHPTQTTVASFAVTVTEDAFLNAWIDFNQDFDWDDPGEQIAFQMPVVAGVNHISYVVPAGISAGNTFARFRVSSVVNVLSSGIAPDGEVEDLALSLIEGSVPTSISVSMAASAPVLRHQSGNLVLSDGQKVVSLIPLTSLADFSLALDDAENALTLDSSEGEIVPLGGLQLDGGQGSDTIQLVGAEAFVDLINRVELNQFGTIDATASGSQRIRLNAASVDNADPAQATLTLLLGAGDTVDLVDLANWQMSDPVIVDGQFRNVSVNDVGGQRLQWGQPSAWRNPLESFDVNGDLQVTASDALRVINELSRRAYSDRETFVTIDPLQVDPWPGAYLDTNGDGRISALDALRIINQLARISSSSGESVGGDTDDDERWLYQAADDPNTLSAIDDMLG